MKIGKTIFASLSVVFLLIVAACNKGEDEFLYKGGSILTVTLKGYNGSNEQLVVKIDTFKFKHDLDNNTPIDQSDIYAFKGNQTTAKLTIREKTTGKLVLEKQVNKDEQNVVVNIVYLDGKIITADPPVTDPNTNKVGLYIVNKENNDLADLVLYDNNLELLTIVGKNITPNQWIYLNADFTTTKGPNFQLPVFFKSGTSYAEEDGYFQKNMWASYIDGNPFFPTDGTKGQVRSFVITNSADYSFAIQVQ